MVAGNSTLPLTWSACVCVLISRTTGLLVSSLILSRIGWLQSGFFASTTVTPPAMMNTAVLPPPPFSTNRLSLSLVTSRTFGAAAGCCAATTSDKAQATTSTPRTIIRFMLFLLERRLVAQTRMRLSGSPPANQQTPAGGQQLRCSTAVPSAPTQPGPPPTTGRFPLPG